MAVETLSGVPCHFESGNTIVFEEVFTDFPASSWAATFCLSKNGVSASPVTATESDDTFTFTLSATATAALTPGLYDFAIYVTSGSERATAKAGRLTISANLAASQTPSFAQAQVTLLQSVLAAFNATDKQSVSFNGQSFTRAGVMQYRQELVYWESRVIAERRAAARLRGEPTHRSFGPRFCNG
jgi:hypothetical protein